MIELDPTLALHQKWVLRESGGVQACLRQADLSGVSLPKVRLDLAACSDANFSNANLSGAKFNGASLKYVNFQGADLSNADLSNADLNFANFSQANLTGALFRGADLLHARFDDAYLSWYDFTLLSELAWQAAGNDLEKQMVASFMGRMNRYCWQDFQILSTEHKHWILNIFLPKIKPDDDAPPFLKALHKRKFPTSNPLNQ